MPGRDRTGPEGDGPMTGRGLGRCSGSGKTIEDDDARPVRGLGGGGRGRGARGAGRRMRGRAR